MDAGILGVEDRTSPPEPVSAVTFGANTVCQQTKLTSWREIWTSLSLAEARGNQDIIEVFLNWLFAEAAFGDEGALFRRGRHMQCQRCLINEVRYRATTDVMDIKVCLFCAEEARRLGIAVKALGPNTRHSAHTGRRRKTRGRSLTSDKAALNGAETERV